MFELGAVVIILEKKERFDIAYYLLETNEV